MLAKFKINLEKFNEQNGETSSEELEITMQDASPFITSDIFTSNTSPSGGYKMASIVRDMIDVVIVSPKNLIQKIEECDNPATAIGKVFQEVNQFCGNPKRYCWLQKKSESESKGVEHDTPKSNVKRSKKDE